MLIQPSTLIHPSPFGSGSTARAYTALPNPTNPNSDSQNSANCTQNSPRRTLSQLFASTSSGDSSPFFGFASPFAFVSPLASPFAGLGRGLSPRAGGDTGGNGFDSGSGSGARRGGAVGTGAVGTAPQSAGVATTGAGGGEVGRGGGAERDAGGGNVAESEGGSGPVGAPALAASSAVGTDTAAWQYGHFTFFPADSSRARNRFPHDGHPSVIGMASPSVVTQSGRRPSARPPGRWRTARVAGTRTSLESRT